MKAIAVIGSLNVDHVASGVRPPDAGETVLAERIDVFAGGKGANQAVAIARTGVRVAIYGAVGDDLAGVFETESLRAAGVDTSHLLVAPVPTGEALIIVDEHGDNRIVVGAGANSYVTPDYLERLISTFDDVSIALFQLEIPIRTVTYAARTLRQRGKIIVLDPAPAPHTLPDELLEVIDFITPNENELERLTGIVGHARVEEACDVLLARGVGCVVASLGARGAAVKSAGGTFQHYPAEAVRAIDTTGAGDAFTGAFAAAIARALTVPEAVAFANRVAALTVQRAGAQESYPAAAEIDSLWAGLIAPPSSPAEVKKEEVIG